MRLINADELKQTLGKSTVTIIGYGKAVILDTAYDIIDNAPIVTGVIDANDFKKRINNMQYVYIQSCAEDVIDAIDCEVTYFKEKMTKGPNSNS